MSIEGQGHFLTLAQGHLHMKLGLVLSVTTGPFSAKACRDKEMKIHQHNAGHMTKMAAMPIYDKNTSKIFFSGITGLIFDETLYEASET